MVMRAYNYVHNCILSEKIGRTTLKQRKELEYVPIGT